MNNFLFLQGYLDRSVPTSFNALLETVKQLIIDRIFIQNTVESNYLCNYTKLAYNNRYIYTKP